MRILMLQGLYCTSKLWKQAASCLKEHDLLFMEYSHEVTAQAAQVMDLASWIASQLPRDIDVIIGHSMGGILALQLAHDFGVPVKCVICIESNLCPAEPFYRNLVMKQSMATLGVKLQKEMAKEAVWYQDTLAKQLQEQFDYSPLTDITVPIHMIYGDRGICEYADRIQDLNLHWETVKRLQFHFLRNACHMPMLEQCEDTYRCIENILYAATDKPAG